MTESYRVRILETHTEDAYTGTDLGKYIVGETGVFTPMHPENDEYFETAWGQEGYLAGDFIADEPYSGSGDLYCPSGSGKDLYCFYAVKVERLGEDVL